MKVTIRCCLGSYSIEILDVEPSTTVEELKKILCKKINYNDDLQTLWFYYDESKLFDEKVTLNDYGIENESTLVAMPRNSRPQLGSKFANLTVENSLKTQKWSKIGPPWRVAKPGLCLEGRCINEDCATKGQSVVISIGYKRFDILNDPSKQTTPCPICKSYVNPETCAFNNCWWRFQGKLQETEHKEPTFCSSNWKFADNSYHYFDQQVSGMVTWRQLIIETVESKPSES